MFSSSQEINLLCCCLRIVYIVENECSCVRVRARACDLVNSNKTEHANTVIFMEDCLHRTMQHNITQYVMNTHAYGISNKDVIMDETMTCYIIETQTKIVHTKII